MGGHFFVLGVLRSMTKLAADIAAKRDTLLGLLQSFDSCAVAFSMCGCMSIVQWASAFLAPLFRLIAVRKPTLKKESPFAAIG